MPDGSAILFGGSPEIPPPEVFENARKNNPIWYQQLEVAYSKFAQLPENKGIYPDTSNPKGATIEQIGLCNSLYFGYEWYCLLARKVPKSQITRLKRVINYSPQQVVETLKRIGITEGFFSAQALHYDGKTGHCISVCGYNEIRDRFIYHDPWPLKSLLCKENNMADVDAKPEEKYWSVTSEELERVIYCIFLLPHYWARLQEVKFDLMYDSWKKSQFFEFFHLNKIDEVYENGICKQRFTAGPFKESIALFVNFNEPGKIVSTSLLINKNWMIINFNLALDISKSFITAFAPPPPDKDKYLEMSTELWKLRDPQFLQSIREINPSESKIIKCIHVFTGLVDISFFNTELAVLSFKNSLDNHFHEINFDLF